MTSGESRALEARPTVPAAPRLPWQIFLSEMIGTAALLVGGLSLVILMFGAGSSIASLVPNLAMRRSISGFLFGAIGAAIALSPVGEFSGAHINPAVTLGFLLMGKLKPRPAFGYVVAQLGGAALGSIPLLAWGDMGRSISFGASLPGAGYPTWAVLVGEVATTFGLVLATALVVVGLDPLRVTNVAMALNAASLPLAVVPFLVLMNDREYVGEHVNGRLANVLVLVVVALACVLAVVSLPLELAGG